MSNTPTHGSDVQVTPEWWKASDGRFYPPELHPDYVKPAPPPPAPAPPVASPPAAAPAAASAAAAPAAAAAPSTSSGPSLSERMRAQADRVGEEASEVADTTIMSPSTPAAGGADHDLSLADRLRAEADRVGDEAAAAADSSVGGLGDSAAGLAGGAGGAVSGAAGDLAGGAGDGLGAAAAGAAGAVGAAGAAAAGAIPGVGPGSETDVRATMPASPAMHETIMQSPQPPAVSPAMPPAPGAAPAMPPIPGAPAMPPAPGAAPAMPPAPGMPPAPSEPAGVIEGPGGITYTAAPDAVVASSYGAPEAVSGELVTDYEQPAAMAVSTKKKASTMAGLGALIGGAAAIAGSLLQWGDGEVVGADGVQKAIIDITGFNSSGIFAAVGGGVLILCALLFFSGIAKQLLWAIVAFLTGAVIVGAVVFSILDIRDLPSRYKAEWSLEPLAADADIISMTPALGIWLALGGGIVGVLSAALVNRR